MRECVRSLKPRKTPDTPTESGGLPFAWFAWFAVAVRFSPPQLPVEGAEADGFADVQPLDATLRLPPGN